MKRQTQTTCVSLALTAGAVAAAGVIGRAIVHQVSHLVLTVKQILPWTARLASWIHGIFPGLCTEATALATRFLPDAGHPDDRQAKGFESESSRIPSVVQRRNNQAASANNEFAAPGSIF